MPTSATTATLHSGSHDQIKSRKAAAGAGGSLSNSLSAKSLIGPRKLACVALLTPSAGAPSPIRIQRRFARHAPDGPEDGYQRNALRTGDRRRRDPVRKARGQAPVEGDRTAQAPRPAARVGAIRWR